MKTIKKINKTSHRDTLLSMNVNDKIRIDKDLINTFLVTSSQLKTEFEDTEEIKWTVNRVRNAKTKKTEYGTVTRIK